MLCNWTSRKLNIWVVLTAGRNQRGPWNTTLKGAWQQFCNTLLSAGGFPKDRFWKSSFQNPCSPHFLKCNPVASPYLLNAPVLQTSCPQLTIQASYQKSIASKLMVVPWWHYLKSAWSFWLSFRLCFPKTRFNKRSAFVCTVSQHRSYNSPTTLWLDVTCFACH